MIKKILVVLSFIIFSIGYIQAQDECLPAEERLNSADTDKITETEDPAASTEKGTSLFKLTSDANRMSLNNVDKRIAELLSTDSPVDTIKSYFGSNKKRAPGDIEFDSTYKVKKKWSNYVIPFFEIIAENGFVWALDRYIGKAPWAYISMESVKSNFNHAFVWDADNFKTNVFMHPYHGNTYFNFARSSGLTFWESAPYVLEGSFMWEFFMEINHPSMNDLINTTIGGIALGEMTYRISSLIIDERTSGGERVWREVVAFIINPTRGVNRFLYGDLTKVRSKSRYEIEPISGMITLGPNYFFEAGKAYNGNGNLSLKLDLFYGNPYINKSRKPFDYFSLKGIANIGTQSLMSQLNVNGILFGKNYNYKANQKMLAGIFQQFDYYNYTYYKIFGQSFGPGIVYKFPTVKDVDFETSMYFTGFILGGSNNTEKAFKYEADGTAFRDYNFALGFTNKFESILTAKNVGYLFLGLYNFMFYNIEGAEGNDNLIIFNPRLGVKLTDKLDAGVEANYYRRQSHYDYYGNYFSKVWELKLFVSQYL